MALKPSGGTSQWVVCNVERSVLSKAGLCVRCCIAF